MVQYMYIWLTDGRMKEYLMPNGTNMYTWLTDGTSYVCILNYCAYIYWIPAGKIYVYLITRWYNVFILDYMMLQCMHTWLHDGIMYVYLITLRYNICQLDFLMV